MQQGQAMVEIDGFTIEHIYVWNLLLCTALFAGLLAFARSLPIMTL